MPRRLSRADGKATECPTDSSLRSLTRLRVEVSMSNAAGADSSSCPCSKLTPTPSAMCACPVNDMHGSVGWLRESGAMSRICFAHARTEYSPAWTSGSSSNRSTRWIMRMSHVKHLWRAVEDSLFHLEGRDFETRDLKCTPVSKETRQTPLVKAPALQGAGTVWPKRVAPATAATQRPPATRTSYEKWQCAPTTRCPTRA